MIEAKQDICVNNVKKKGKYQEKQVCSFGWWLMAGADLF
jgi:hypothetical protein